MVMCMLLAVIKIYHLQLQHGKIDHHQKALSRLQCLSHQKRALYLQCWVYQQCRHTEQVIYLVVDPAGSFYITKKTTMLNIKPCTIACLPTTYSSWWSSGGSPVTRGPGFKGGRFMLFASFNFNHCCSVCGVIWDGSPSNIGRSRSVDTDLDRSL